MRRGPTRRIGFCLLGAGVSAVLAVSLAGCGGSTMDTLSKKLANPFSKKEVPLPGERIAVITDATLVDVDPAEAARPIQLPPPQANASWSEPGGAPGNNLGHLVLNDQLRKVWAADAGTGSSSSGRLSAVPLVADGKVFTLDAAGTVSAFSSASGGKVWSVSVTPEEREEQGGLRRRARARRRSSLCGDRLWHRREHRCR